MKAFALLTLTSLATACTDFTLDMSDLDERANPCFAPIFALGAGVAATTFWYGAAGTCPASAKEDNINNAQCGLSATAGVVFTLLTGFSLQGIARYGASSKRDEPTLPINDTTLLDGYAVTYCALETKLSLPYPVEDGWTHYQFHAEDLSGLGKHVTNVHSVHESGKNRVTQPLTPIDSLSKRDGGYTAYLAWENGHTAIFDRLPVCKSKDAANAAAINVWNYGHSNSQGSFCASLEANGQKLAQGEFSIRNTAFNDQAGNC